MVWQDLLNAAKASDIMTDLDLAGKKSGRWVEVHTCSAKTGEGLEEGLAKLIEETKH